MTSGNGLGIWYTVDVVPYRWLRAVEGKRIFFVSHVLLDVLVVAVYKCTGKTSLH